jgi:hypothetical protein
LPYLPLDNPGVAGVFGGSVIGVLNNLYRSRPPLASNLN